MYASFINLPINEKFKNNIVSTIKTINTFTPLVRIYSFLVNLACFDKKKTVMASV